MQPFDHTPPDCAILGLGYLGRPLAQKLYERGARVRALKRSLTSDDINLPIELDIADLNRSDVFQTAFWQEWRSYPTWICLLPPSSAEDYAGLLRQWITLAEQSGVNHLIFTGSTSVYGDRVRVCDENSALEPQTRNARLIAQAEALLAESRVPHTDVLRLGGLYSAERHPVSKLSGKTQLAGGQKPVNVVHQDIAVEALFQTACRPGGKRIRNIVEPQHPTRAVFYRSEAAKLGLPTPEFDPEDHSSGKIVKTVCDNAPSL